MWKFSWNEQTSSFYDFITLNYPHLLQAQRSGLSQFPLSSREEIRFSESGLWASAITKGTTVLALRYRDGALVAGDRLATEGFQVSARKIEKVYKTDEHSAIAIAGAAGPCIEMARLFQVELEHYEKLEGTELSTEGKANKLSQMIKGNLALAMQGLIVIPLLASYDLKKQEGRIFKYDITGGRYEETEFYATGSGGKDARSTLKKLYKPGMAVPEAIAAVTEALYDAAEEDRATAGPDPIRGIYPTIKTVTREGIQDVEEQQIKECHARILDDRRQIT